MMVEEGKVEEMTPPKPVKCHGYGLGEPPCEYVSRQGLPNHQMITEDLAMHQRVCSAMQRTVGTVTNSSRPGARPQRLERPEIGEQASEEDWRRFCAAWNRYKNSCQLEGEEASVQLYYCCTTELQKTLDGLGVGSNCAETELIGKIKEAAVRKQNLLLNTLKFLNTTADGDPVRKHAAKLNRKALECEFVLSKGETDYSKKMVQFQLVSGLGDSEIQEQVLAEYAVRPKMTLEETINFVEAKQLARKDVAEITRSGNEPGVSKLTEYKRSKNGGKPGNEESRSKEKCMYCGNGGHGKKPEEMVRKEKCRAWDQECHKCQKKGHLHYARKCASKKAEVRKVERKESSEGSEVEDGGSMIGSVYGAGHFCKISLEQTSTGAPKLLLHHE